MRPAFIPVGQIVNAHGIRGEVKLLPQGIAPQYLTGCGAVGVDNDANGDIRLFHMGSSPSGMGC